MSLLLSWVPANAKLVLRVAFEQSRAVDASGSGNHAQAAGAKFGSLRAEVEAVYRYNENNSFNQGGVDLGAYRDIRRASAARA